MTGPLQGRIALVTGGAGGIGRAICARLAADGATVVLADLDPAAVETAAGDIPGDVHPLVLEVTDPGSRRAAVWAAARSRSASTTVAPSAASRAQIARPIPPVPPVTSAVRPLSGPVMVAAFPGHCRRSGRSPGR